MQRGDQPVVATGLERIAARAGKEPKLRFSSLAHHITREQVWGNLGQIPSKSAPGVDGQTVEEAKDSFNEWIEPMLRSMHRKGYRAPVIRRVYIPKPGKQQMRPLVGYPASAIVLCNAAWPRYCRLFMSRTSCHALLAVGVVWVLTMLWRH